jgi:hypothetical protein
MAHYAQTGVMAPLHGPFLIFQRCVTYRKWTDGSSPVPLSDLPEGASQNENGLIAFIQSPSYNLPEGASQPILTVMAFYRAPFRSSGYITKITAGLLALLLWPNPIFRGCITTFEWSDGAPQRPLSGLPKGISRYNSGLVPFLLCPFPIFHRLHHNTRLD